MLLDTVFEPKALAIPPLTYPPGHRMKANGTPAAAVKSDRCSREDVREGRM